MSKHTPGPWYPISGDIYKDIGDTRHLVAQCEGWGEETQHNARLIAAAPDMLAALREAREVIAFDRGALADCHTGPDGLDDDGAAGVAEYDAALAKIDAAIATATGE